MEFSKACEVLGVSENASRDEIERKYTILLKKRKLAKAEGDFSNTADIDIDQVTSAYNLLMGYEEPKANEVPAKVNSILKKAGIDQEKAQNFWYYNKFRVLIGIALLLAVVFTLKSCLTAERPDFNLAFIGNIYFSDNDLLKTNIKKAVPDIKVPTVDGALPLFRQ